MNRWIGVLAAGVAILGAATFVSAQNPPGGPGGGGGGPGRGPGGGMMRMGMPGQARPTALDELVMVLGDLNLRPTFTLSDDQKTKLQSLRDAVKTAQEKWTTDNAEELAEIRESMNSLMQAGPDGDPEAWRDVMEQNMALMETSPDGEAETEQARALLTPEQAKAVEARFAEIEAERQKMWQQMGAPGGRGPGGPGGPGGQNRQGGGQDQRGGRPGV